MDIKKLVNKIKDTKGEMEEIIGMSDRTIVMHEGRITGELQRSELSEESIMQLATGNVKRS